MGLQYTSTLVYHYDTEKKLSSPKIQVVKMIQIDDVIGALAICALFFMAWVATP